MRGCKDTGCSWVKVTGDDGLLNFIFSHFATFEKSGVKKKWRQKNKSGVKTFNSRMLKMVGWYRLHHFVNLKKILILINV
jgi:hypothetical protein